MKTTYNGWANWETWSFNLWVDEYLDNNYDIDNIDIIIDDIYMEAYNSLQSGGEFGDFRSLEELENVNLSQLKDAKRDALVVEKTTREVLEDLSNYWLNMIKDDESNDILKEILIQGFGGFSNSSYGDLEVEYEETFGEKIKIV